MDTQNNRLWYKRKRYLIPVGVLALLVLSGSDNTPQNHSTQEIIPVTYQAGVPANDTSQISQYPISSVDNTQNNVPISAYANSGLSNDNYYTNSAGNKVHSPAYSNTIPVGASAQCRDGTFSFSQSRRGICSHHGGVAQWL